MINRTNTVLGVLLVAVVVMTTLTGIDYSKPNIEILPDMKYTPAWEAFAANPNFTNGRTMQPPVPGTIPRGPLPLYYAATKEDAVRAGQELENPYSLRHIEATISTGLEAEEMVQGEASPDADSAGKQEAARREALVRERFSASIERGGEVYRTFCVSCHGSEGAGDGLVTQRGFPPPPSMLIGKSVQMKDGQLFHILTYGQGSMAPFAAQLSRERRWDVINFVRDLQSNAPPVPDTEPDLAPLDTRNGPGPTVATGEESPAAQPPDGTEKSDISNDN